MITAWAGDCFMHHQRCVCPQCGTSLRVKDRVYLNRPVPCPDCRTLLVLKATDDERLEAALAEAPVETKTAPAPSAPTRRLPAWVTNVTVVSWAATLLVAAMIATVALRPKRRIPPRTPEIAARPVAAPSDKDDARDPASALTADDELPDSAVVGQVEAEPPVSPADQGDLSDPPPPGLLDDDAPPADAADAVAAHQTAMPLIIAAEPLPAVDLDAALAQPLKAFHQPRSVTRRELLDLLEELLGAPIRYDVKTLGDAAHPLEQKLTLELEDVTVGEILARVLDKTELVFERERDGLRLRKRDDSARP